MESNLFDRLSPEVVNDRSQAMALFYGYKYHPYPDVPVDVIPGWWLGEPMRNVGKTSKSQYLCRTTKDLRYIYSWDMLHQIIEAIEFDSAVGVGIEREVHCAPALYTCDIYQAVTTETGHGGTYPSVRDLYINQHIDRKVAVFLTLSDYCRDAIAEAGFVSYYDRKLELNRKLHKAKKNGSTDPSKE